MIRSLLPASTAVAVALFCFAERGVANDAIPSAAAGVSAVPKPPRLLVLRDGKVIEGGIQFAQGGYEVAVPGGRFVLSEPIVWFTAQSREAAYAELRERLPDKSANGHVALATWCVENRLYREARDELKLALQIEPKHAEARKTLVSLERTLAAQPNYATTGQPAPPVGIQQASFEEPRKIADEPEPSPARPVALPSLPGEQSTGDMATLGGLPRATARDFVSKVQPILINGCATSACHGTASKNAFRLQNVRPGNPGFKALTQRNFEAVRAQLLAESPQSSPVIVAARQPGHGGVRKPLFVGPKGHAQLQALAEWVAIAARTLPPVTEDSDPYAEPRRLFETAAYEEPATRTTEERATTGPSTEAIAIEPASDLIRRVLAEERPDAFDPDEFNRRHASQPKQLSPFPGDGPTP